MGKNARAATDDMSKNVSKPGLYIRWLLLSAGMIAAFMAAPLWYGYGRWRVVLWYAVGVNVATLVVYLYDKDAARGQRLRVPEGVLHLLALAGGSPAALLAQRASRHKIRKAGFRNITWLIIAGHLALAIRGTMMPSRPLGAIQREWVYLAVGFLAAMNVFAAAVYAHGTRRQRTTSATVGYLLVLGGGALGAAFSDRLADGYAWLPTLAGTAHLGGAVYLAFHAVVPLLPWLS